MIRGPKDVPWYSLWRLVAASETLQRLLPGVLAYGVRRRAEHWEQLWSTEGQRPASELATAVPSELLEAVESGWIPAGAAVMDLGSGAGQVSAWLANRGFRVLGADLSSMATEIARSRYAGIGDRLEFRTLDICEAQPERGRFDALVDRGCFHGIPSPLRQRYAANVAAWAKDGARLLLLTRVDDSEQSVTRQIREVFGPYFEIVRVQPTAEPLVRSTGPIPRMRKAGVAVWMVRRMATPSS